MRRILVLAVVAVLAFTALNLITVEVKPVDAHEGAVAFAQPTLTATFLGGSGATNSPIPTLPDGATPTLVVETHKYVGPTPTKKSLLQILLPTGCITITCNGGGTFNPPPGGGTGCSPLSKETKTVSITTYAKLAIVGAGGARYDYTTEPVTTSSTQQIDYLTCTNVNSATVQWSFSGAPSYGVGTFYFTNGWGTYAFSAEIWLVVAGSPDVKIGSTQLAVTPV